jgi:surface protein
MYWVIVILRKTHDLVCVFFCLKAIFIQSALTIMKNFIYLFLILAIVFSSCETEEPIPTYTLSTTVSPIEGGKIIASPQMPNYKEGEVVTLTPEPNEHWVFKQWEGDGTGSSTPLQLTMNSNKSVVGVFVKRDYPLTITIEGEGTVEEKIVPNPGGREYPHGTTVELTPKPKEGWVFDSWGGDLSGTDSPKNIKVDKAKSVTVKFKTNPNFYLNANGLTCMCPNAKAGEIGFINGVRYEAVDNNLLKTRLGQGADLTKICTSSVNDMSNLFVNTEFNQAIGNWDVSNVFRMERMFSGSKFNQPIDKWNVSKVTNMVLMFGATPFNQPIGDWDVSRVTNMSGMFTNSSFNQPIGNWNVSNVFNMANMFGGSKFNQPLDKWNVKKVVNMTMLFYNSPFNQNISTWCVTYFTSEPELFSTNSPLTEANKPKWWTCPG